MGDRTGIEWCDATWNPIRGCTRVSEGCKHCYAERQAARFSGAGQAYEGLALMRNGQPRWTGEVRLIESQLEQPIHWRRPRRVFVNSMSDLFHEALPDDAIDRVFAVMAAAHWHTFQVLTKRSRRMVDYFHATPAREPREEIVEEEMRRQTRPGWPVPRWPGWPLPNVWLGVSAEHQAAADERVGNLLDTPAAVRFVSAEPLLGPIDLRRVDCSAWETTTIVNALIGEILEDSENGMVGAAFGARLNWVIVGGESGPGARPLDLDWIRSIRDQCAAAGAACFVKQDSGPASGRRGRIPFDLWGVKEFPR